MHTQNRIVSNLQDRVQRDAALEEELTLCIIEASWTPPQWRKPLSTLDDFYTYLNQLLGTIPVDTTFSNLFHGLYYIVSQRGNALQQDARFAWFQQWLATFVEVYAGFMNTAESANGLSSFIADKTFSIENFEVNPGGYNCFNSFFSRHIKPGKRPIGAATFAFAPPSAGNPIPPSPAQDPQRIHRNMCDDDVITVPADSVYQFGCDISSDSTITVSKGNTYSVKELLAGSEYADRFADGIFTHSYLSVFTYHRYHTPVRGVVLETSVITGEVFANVIKTESGDLSATDGTGYQFKQDRGLIVLDSPIGLVALLPIGMDFISSCNFSVDVGDYLNKGDEFGYFLFGGSDMIMLFERKDIDIQGFEKDQFYKLGQVFGKCAERPVRIAPPKRKAMGETLFISSKDSDSAHLPIVKMNVSALEPPEEGKGVRIAVYQGTGWVGDRRAIEHNLASLEGWAAAAAKQKAQVLVLPELFLCGYNIMPDDVDSVVMNARDALALVAPIAKHNELAILCPYAEVTELRGRRQCFDSMVLVANDGSLLRNYRKTHLWGDDEKKNWWFPYVDDPDEAYQVSKVNGINIGLLNCYEAEFPELSRILALKGAQVILIPTAADVGTVEQDGSLTNWAYPDVSKTAIPGNAYQNQVFCVYANHALWELRSDGKTVSGVYLGNSTIADPYGQLMVHADNVETMLVADCIPSNYRPTHPDGQSNYIRDRRPALYAQLSSMEARFPNGQKFLYPDDPNVGWHKK